MAIALGLALIAAVVIAISFGSLGVALLAVAWLNIAILLAIVQVRRRVAEAHRRIERWDRKPPEDQLSRLGSRVDAMETRLVGILEADRLAGARREQAHEARNEGLEARYRDLTDSIGTIRRRTDELHRAIARSPLSRTVREVEALIQLYEALTPRAAMPLSGAWALDPTGILMLVQAVRDRSPQLILELGSGTSSIWLAYAVETCGSGRLISVDHDARFATRTTDQLIEHGLNEVAKVLTAPLINQSVDGQDSLWYDLTALNGIEDVDLLVVDGPPGDVGPNSRYPAVPALIGALNDGAWVVIDDAAREDEKQIVEQWREHWDELTPVDQAVAENLAVLEKQSL